MNAAVGHVLTTEVVSERCRRLLLNGAANGTGIRPDTRLITGRLGNVIPLLPLVGSIGGLVASRAKDAMNTSVRYVIAGKIVAEVSNAHFPRIAASRTIAKLNTVVFARRSGNVVTVDPLVGLVDRLRARSAEAAVTIAVRSVLIGEIMTERL
jgi:hypothetical protein